MKKLSAMVLAAAALCLMLASCGPAKEYGPYIKESQDIITMLQKGEYDEVKDIFRADMQESISIEDWALIFTSKLGQLGAFEKFGASSAAKQYVDDEGDHIVVTVNSRYEKGDWEMRFFYDLSGKLVAIFV